MVAAGNCVGDEGAWMNCSMCESHPAETVYGLPVCHSCNRMLRELQGELEDIEAEDPVLKALGKRVEQQARQIIKGDGK